MRTPLYKSMQATLLFGLHLGFPPGIPYMIIYSCLSLTTLYHPLFLIYGCRILKLGIKLS
jgi:hypothetical protein